MNRYGLMAQRHWARWLPARYAAAEDPTSFFSDLGSQAETMIDQLADHIAGDDPGGEGYLERVGSARHAARRRRSSCTT